MKRFENYRHEFELRDDAGEKKIYLSVNAMNLEKEKTDRILAELEKTKGIMEEILAG